MILLSGADAEAAVRNVSSGVLATAAHDAAFRERLKADPTAVLRDRGLTIPPTITVTVEDSVPVREPTPCRDDHLVLTPPPDGAQLLSAGDLDKVAGGGVLWGMDRALRFPARLLGELSDPTDNRSFAQKATALGDEAKDAWNDKSAY